MPRLRRTSRILVVDERDRVLLFLTRAPDSSGFARWMTPGGGVEGDETHLEAGVRELFEETGLQDAPLEGPVFSLDFDVTWDQADHDRGHAEYYVTRTMSFTPASDNWTDDEQVDLEQHRWWSVDELDATDDPYEPEELPELVRRAIRSSRPDASQH
ncbi:NUDIX hydrolase [Schumannella sp. 10F1B-5-1]|uniref:NUDIX hydrolase n=1 Tax=Schumannella sp. 10F1B-5-1 TaxID=2590780 RepID=UPI00113261E6|nr:NUDIX domain-containing protein [Schumannella sp. 10F1B-5-1]TPW70913.1 NUDIX domain-containing protein [Schumannella sp. 10F1B-5-1]